MERQKIALLPGLLCDAAIWDAQVKALDSFFEVDIADFSSHDSLDDMAKNVLSDLDGPLSVVGFSMGGRVALQMVGLAPDRIESLVLIGSDFDPVGVGEIERRQKLVDLAYSKGMGALADAWLPTKVNKDRLSDAELMEPLKSMVLRATPEQHERQITALLNRQEARDLLPRIECRTLVLIGRQESGGMIAANEEMTSLIPDSELVVVEHSGHMTTVEQPEKVSSALLRWLGCIE